jgi:hypothetical protein
MTTTQTPAQRAGECVPRDLAVLFEAIGPDVAKLTALVELMDMLIAAREKNATPLSDS